MSHLKFYMPLVMRKLTQHDEKSKVHATVLEQTNGTLRLDVPPQVQMERDVRCFLSYLYIKPSTRIYLQVRSWALALASMALQ